jgi:hypothetical protein
MQLAQKKKEKSPCKDGIKEKCLLKRLGPFKSSQILFIETIGKMPCRHLWNWPDRTHGRFKGMKE